MKYIVLSFLFIVIMLNGCVIRYHPAIRGSHVPPLISAQTKDVKKYTLSSLDFNDGLTYEPYENNLLFRGRHLKVWSSKKIDTNFGFQLFGGRYSVARLEEYKGDYTFYGGGVEVNICRYWKIYSFDIGIGFHLQNVIELGEYYEFRKESNEDGRVENTTSFFQPMFSIFPMLRCNINDTTNVGFQCAVGYPGIISPVFSYQNKAFTGWVSWLPSQHPTEEYHPSFSIGIGVLR